MRRRCHGEAERCLQIRLLKDGKDPTRVRNFELGVEVNLIVNRVNEAVQALAGVHVEHVRVDDQFVGRGKIIQADPHPVRHLRRIEVHAVEGHAMNGCGDGVNEG